ncbi:choice-of-anchor D domain-containing protein [Anaeromyxobacter paludicola]|uniref:Multicopper oxidase type 2 n=1 Tax=Anaeromyxobacter paludicola TaxID=2918171 RepID=A0ABM7XCN2_9BACT|nr:choice-of-anchor D domain-containing protein [Anaeromyxobacter paludicola]BDG09626.1 hypothetical protein AMPC_27390 [Anaeromyxobacter paludicola]
MRINFIVLATLVVNAALAPTLALSQTQGTASSANVTAMRRVTNADRQAAAQRRAAAKAAAAPATTTTPTTTTTTTAKAGLAAALAGSGVSAATLAPTMNPGGTPDVFNVGNYANSPLPVRACSVTTTQLCYSDADCPVNPTTQIPETCTTYVSGGIKKFVDGLPGLGSANANNLGQYIPVATPDTTRFPNSDYYEIGVVNYTQQFHTNLPATTQVRGYYDKLAAAPNDQLPHYLGPVIVAQKDRPVRIKFTNELPTSDQPGSKLFLPVDTTVMGAGMGPDGSSYTENRAELHLHGGVTPWISDGTPHQWITPAGDPATLKRGVSQRNVPDMPDPGDGAGTYYYTNQQSARFMFYHDHSYGVTRLNVYAGEAAGYLLTDPVEEDLISNKKVIPDLGGVYHLGVPLILQDKTFVPDTTQLAQQDPTWDTAKWGGPGNLWFPHVYVPNQNPYDSQGVNAFGRWDYGPWFWPPWPSTPGEQCPVPPATGPCTPGLPNPSIVPEGFMDTPLVNGTAYPTFTVDRKAYRFRILNAANDRSVNLSIFFADASGTEVKMVPATPHGASDPVPACAPGITVGTPGYVSIVNGVAVTNPASGCWPSTWPTDGRDGGVPDPTTAGPSFIQIGSEGGFLPAPVQIDPTPVGYEYNRRNIVVLNVSTHALTLGPAERADVIVDFSQVPAGSKLILYNDAPAPFPAFDTRYDYYTGNMDQASSGGAPTTLPGYGPNTRTFMQFVVSSAPAAAPFDLASLQAAFNGTSGQPGPFAASQPVPVVPESAYGPAYGTTLTDNYARIQNTTGLTFTPINGSAPVTIPLLPKGIQELFDPAGRMNATLATEIPNTTATTQTTIPVGYVDPPTDFTLDGQPQLWKITHNGVDTHTVHFHLFNVQVVNRVGWDGQIRPPDPNELGWKESVRMSPLEDVIVAVLPITPVVPFVLPDMHRLQDVTQPAGGAVTYFDPLTGATVNGTNAEFNYGGEYVWHCHLLGHEENDMMRPIVHLATPEAPSGLAVSASGTSVTGSFTDNSASATEFAVQQSADAAFTAPTTTTVPATAQGPVAVGFSGTVADATVAWYYRVQAVKRITGPYGDNVVASAWSNTAMLGASPTAALAPATLDFGNQLVGVVSAPLTATLSATGAGALSIGAATLSGVTPGDFAVTTTCAGSLVAGQTCDYAVTFKPGALGQRGAVLSVATSDPANPVVTATLVGVGVAPAASVAPTALTFAPQLLGTTSAPALTVTLTNAGTAPLGYTGFAIAGANPADFAATTGCPASVAVGASCTFQVTFTPGGLGARAGRLTLNTTDPANPAVLVTLAGTGIAPAITLSPASLTFPNQLVATTSAAQVVTVGNAGTAPLLVSGVGLSGANAAEFAQTSTCPASLAVGATCTISVTFTPATVAPKAASLGVLSSDPARPTASVALAGTVVAPTASLTPASLTFGAQVIATTSPAQVATLANTGTAPLAVSGISVTGDFAQTSNCPASLAVGASCTISVTFTPTTSGARSGALTVASSDPVNPTVSASLAGTGTALALAPAAVAFGNQLVGTTSAGHTVTLLNTGTTALALTSVTLTGTNAASFSFNNNCGTSIAAGRSCTVSVRFSPTAAGPATAALSVATADPVSPQTVALTGTGTAPVASATPSSLTFSSGMNVTSAAQTVTLTNTGTAPLTLNGIGLGGASPSQFAQTNNCGGGLAVGASCTIDVTFTPTTYGGVLTKTATLTINAAAPATPVSVGLSGTIVVPTYAVSPTALTFAKQAVGTTSAAQVVTITNGNAAPLGIRGITLGGSSPWNYAQTNNCPATLATGASCTVNVTFTPTSAGTKTATLNVRAAAPAASQSVTLTGAGQ